MAETPQNVDSVPTREDVEAAFTRGVRAAVAEIAEVCSLAAIHGPEAFEEAVKRIAESAALDYESWLSEARAEAWDSAIEAVAWCLDNGESSPAAALAYTHKSNPHRTPAPTGPEGGR